MHKLSQSINYLFSEQLHYNHQSKKSRDSDKGRLKMILITAAAIKMISTCIITSRQRIGWCC